MILTTQLFVFILLMHYLADFVLQTQWQAENKSTNLNALGLHVFTYSLTWLMASFVWFGNWTDAVTFATITFIAHFATDFVTSKATGYFFKKQDHHHGFMVIGADQILHYLQLYYTFMYLTN